MVGNAVAGRKMKCFTAIWALGSSVESRKLRGNARFISEVEFEQIVEAKGSSI